jgi:hypothetical protein
MERWRMEKGASLTMDAIRFQKDGQRGRREGSLNKDIVRYHQKRFHAPPHPLLPSRGEEFFCGELAPFRNLDPGRSIPP